jgi:hypothetical protein
MALLKEVYGEIIYIMRYFSKEQGETQRRTGVYTRLHEDLSSGSDMHKSPMEKLVW